ncbi:MAG: hypothetical protein V1750_04415, partial [Acidobacteriota bacterium]
MQRQEPKHPEAGIALRRLYRKAEKHLRKSLEIDPRNRRALEYLTWLLSAQNRYDDLAALYTERVQHAANREERAQAYLAAAGFLHTRPDKRQLALEYYEKVLGVDPGNERALSCLVDAHTADENWAALIRAYENALRSRPRGDSELGMYLQIGMLQWRKLGDLDAAEEYFRRVRKIEPANPAMLDFYRDYHGQRGEPQKLLLVLSQAQKLEADAGRKLALGVEIARLAEGEPTALEKAIDAWKGVQRQEPKHPEAGIALRRLYRKAEKWNALLEALKDDIERLPADRVDDKIARYLEIVEIYRDRMGIPVMVINTYMAILALNPTHPGALDALAAKYEEAGRWNDLINILARKAESCAEKVTRIALLRRVASLWVDKFGNHGQAVKPLEEILALDAADAEAAPRLKDIYQRRRAWRSLLELLRRELAALPREAQQAQVVEMAKLAAERLGDMKEAIALWNQALAMAPEQRDGQALAALASLYERDRRWAAMVEVLQRQLAMLPASDIRAQVALLERIGSYYSERLAAPRQAAQAYRAILEREPTHAKALRVLRDLYAVAGDFAALEELFGGMGAWEELVETLNAVAERSPDPKLKLQLYARVAELCRERLRQPERAVKAYERILAVDPTNLAAAQALVPIYRQGEKWPRLLSTYEILLGHAEGKSEQLALYQEIRKLCEERLGSRSLAFQWCARAYAVAPEDGQLRADLARLAAEADAWEELAELYHRRVARIDSQGETAAEWLLLTRELARTAHTRLGRADEARAHYARLLEVVPEDGEALTALEQIFTQGQMWAELLGIYRRRLLSESEPARRLDLLF